MKKLLPIVFALLIEAANAQTPFVQSRFSGEPILEAGAQCVNCMPHKDGVLEYRIANHRVESNTATFSIQLRVLGGDPETINRTGLAFASVRLTYNPLAFGNNAAANGQCSYAAASAFTSYRSSFNDTTADILTVTMAKMNPRTKAGLVALKPDNTFQDFITMHCVFERKDEDADIAISGTDILPNMIYVYTNPSDTATEFVRRNIFPLAHNSLRGLRLDGKNYAEDYARYSDGKGVFLRFSDDLSTDLTSNHFSIDKANEAITVPRAIPESAATVRVEFAQAVSGRILRSSQDEPIIDQENNPLASGAFLAALEYDAHAPRAIAIEMNARTARESTWTVAFSHALDASTIKADNLCLSDELRVVCTDNFQTKASIQSVAPIPADALSTTKMTVVIDERDGTASGSISLAFQRNAVRGEDQRVVEEYQPALEEEVILGGNDTPQIVSPLDGTPIELSLEEAKHTAQIVIVISDEDIGDDLMVSVNTTSNGIVALSLERDKFVSTAKTLQTTLTIVALQSSDRAVAVTIAVTDGMATATSVLMVKVNNTEPTIASVEITPFSAGEQQTITVTITDADLNDDITVSLTTDNEEVISIPMTTVPAMVSDDNATTRTARFEIAAISRGDATVRITVYDGTATTRSQFSMTVDNTEPTIASVEITPFSAGERQTVTVTITDADLNDDITVSLTTDNEGVISIPMTTVPPMVSDDDATMRTASFDIDAISQGSAIVTITVSDSVATTTSQFKITVDNTDPIISPVEVFPFSAGEQQTVTVTITDADLNDDITVSLTTDNEEVISIPMTTVSPMASDDDATMRTARFDIDAISQGSAIVTITARDSVATTTSQFSMTVDNTEPTIALVEITPFSAGERQTVTVTITDADLNDDIMLSLTTDNGVIFITTPTVQLHEADNNATTRTALFEITAISRGNTTVTVTATDSSGATTKSQFRVMVDNTELRISTVNNFSFSAGEWHTVTVIISDADIKDNITVSLTTDNGVIFITTPTVQLIGADDNATTRTASFEITAISRGNTTVTITARDSVATTTSQFKVTVDNTEPTIAPVEITLFSAGEQQTVTVTITDADLNDDITVSLTTDNEEVISISMTTVPGMVSDDDATVRTASFDIDAISQGSAIVTITARDSIATTTSQFSMTVDNTEPTIALVKITPFSAGERQTVTVTITDADLNDDITVSLTTDNEEVISIPMTTVPGMVSDDDATMRTASFDIDAISQGSAIVTITARDSVATTRSQFSMTVDNTEPTIAPVEITPFSAGEQQTVTVTITDADLNDDITVSLTTDNEEVISIPMMTVPVMVSDDDATVRTASFDIDAISQGSAIVTITARDSVATTTSQFSMTVDNTEPMIAPVEITLFSAGEQQTVTVTITDADLNDDITVSLTTDNEEVISIPMTIVPVMVSDDDATVRTASFDIDAISQGSAIVTITARDSVATTRSQFSMTVDNTEPTIASVEITPFSAGERQTATVTITDADLNDDITVSLTTDNEEVISIPMTTVPGMVSDDDATVRTASFDIDAISQGSAIVTITARDSVATTTSQFSMTVNNTEPTIAPVEITPFSAGERQTVTVTITDADLNDDIMLSLTTDNGVIFITTPTVQLHGADNNATTRTAHFDIDAISQGSAIVTITARDSVATTRSQFRVTVDNTELRISTVNNFSFSAGERHTVTVIISDADIKDDITVSLTTDNGVIFITTPTVQLIGADDNATTRTASFEITAISRGNTTVTITARDSTATTTSQFKVTVDNTEPTIAPVEITPFSAGEQQTVTVTITDADINDDITVSLTTDNEEVISILMTTVPGMVSDDDATMRTTSFDIDAISQGSAIVTITARDSVATTTSQFSMTVDNTEPTIALVKITPFSAGERQTVTVTITDADLNDDITVSLTTDNEEVISIPMTTVPGMVSDDDATMRTASFDIDAISQGSAIVTITARDSVATTTSQFSMTVDNTEPTIALVKITPFSAGEQQTVTVTITDADLNDDITVSLTTDNEEVISIPMTTVPVMVSDDDATVRTASFDIDAISQGSAIVTITVRDSTATTTSQFSMTVDNTEPTIAPVEITPFSAGEQQTVTVTITDADLNDDITVSLTTNNEEVISIPMTTVPVMVSDDDATMRTASFDIDAISQGSAIVTITARDSIASTMHLFQATVNNTTPTINAVDNVPLATGERHTVTLMISDADIKDNITIRLTTDDVAISITTPTVRLIGLGNTKPIRTASFEIIAITRGSATVTITANDEVATETREFIVAVDNTIPTIGAVDDFFLFAGDRQTVIVTIIEPDIKDDITIGLTTDNGVLFITTPTVQLFGIDNDATTRTALFEIVAITRGSATATITVSDGVATTTSQFSVTVNNTTPTISSVENFSFSAGERHTVTVIISDADIKDDITIGLTTDTGVLFISTPTVQLIGADNDATTRTARFQITAISRGNTTVTITVSDGVATTTSQFSVTVNNTEPIIAPVENISFSAGERQTVIVRIRDADIKDDITISLTPSNGEAISIPTATMKLIGESNTDPIRTANFEINAISRDNTTITITASDGAATTRSQFSVTVDNTKPTIDAVEDFAFSAGEQRIITVTVSDADIKDDITIHLDASNEAVAITTPTVSLLGASKRTAMRSARFTIRALTSSRTTVHIAAGDTQTTSTSLFEIRIENTNPILSTIEDVVLKVGDSYQLKVRVTDKDIGDSITVTLHLDPDTNVSTTPSLVVVPGGLTQAHFELTAQKAGTTRVTIEASDKKDNKVESHFNVVVMDRVLRLRTRVFLEAPLP